MKIVSRLTAQPRRWVVLAVTFAALALCPAGARSQCIPHSGCATNSGIPLDYAFTQSVNYWAGFAVLPAAGDDKDVDLYTGCGGTGGLLVSSAGVVGMDFVVGDFNHNPLDTYYPRISFGSPSLLHRTYFDSGMDIFPIGQFRVSTFSCYQGGLDVQDVFLEAGESYRFEFGATGFVDFNLALFHNPTSGNYWMNRAGSEFEIVSDSTHVYVAPATDWYGLVIFTNEPDFAGTWYLTIDKLNDCQPLIAGVCQQAIEYSAPTGPQSDYSFAQADFSWTVVATSPSAGDSKSMQVYGACDQTTLLAGSIRQTGETSFVVGDFNHNTTGTYYGYVGGGSLTDPFTIEWEAGPDILNIDDTATGTFGGSTGSCGLARTWDIFLTAGEEYAIDFGETGLADIRVELFRNPGNGTYWAARGSGEWELPDPMTGFSYVAPASDWYGLVVYANDGTASGGFDLTISQCVPLATSVCATRSGWPGHHTLAQSQSYWAIAGVMPATGDDKDIFVAPSCGSPIVLASSAGLLGTDFVVGDFNHNAGGTYATHVSLGSQLMPYTVDWDGDADVLLTGVLYTASVGPGPNCNAVKIWDIGLSVGETYRFGLTKSGKAEIHAALFYNPSNTDYWAGRSSSVLEFTAPGNAEYTAPATDWYGLVVFSDTPDISDYTLIVQPTTPTGIDTEAPREWALHQNQPNPFNPSTRIRYDVPADGGHVTLRVYDVAGRHVRTLVDRWEGAGSKVARWDGRNEHGVRVATGIYFYRIQALGFVRTHKMALLQ